jgi:hypothetical protein
MIPYHPRGAFGSTGQSGMGSRKRRAPAFRKGQLVDGRCGGRGTVSAHHNEQYGIACGCSASAISRRLRVVKATPTRDVTQVDDFRPGSWSTCQRSSGGRAWRHAAADRGRPKSATAAKREAG